LVGKPGWKRPLGRPRYRWVDNIRMDLQEVGCGHMDWNGLAQDRDRWRTIVSAVMNLGVPWNAGNFFTSCQPVSCSRRTLHRGVSKVSKTYFNVPSLFTFKNSVFFPLCIFVFCADLRTNGDYFPIQLKLIGFYNPDEKCLQRSTEWVFK